MYINVFIRHAIHIVSWYTYSKSTQEDCYSVRKAEQEMNNIWAQLDTPSEMHLNVRKEYFESDYSMPEYLYTYTTCNK